MLQRIMTATVQNINSSKALKLGVAFSLVFSAFIWVAEQYLFLEQQLLPKPEGVPFWYFWQLNEPNFITRLSAWGLYIGHQVSIWWLIYAAQKERPQYTDGLHWFNIAALAANAIFITLHLIQTAIWYDGLAQDVIEQSAQWSVIVLLFVVLMMENQRRGMFFGKKLNFVTAASTGLRKYHGYYFAWATIYTFWYHPMVGTSGHIVGFLYMFLLLLQGSLFFTRAHLNPKWTIFVEVMVVIHALLVALMNGDNWPMFLFGFLGVFVVTQMYGLPLSQKMRWLIWSMFIGLVIAVYSFKGWGTSYEVIFIAGTEWACAILFAGLILFIQSDFMKRITGRAN